MLKDFAKINTFLTVVKEKSFSKASKKLGISQPAVTQQIKLLEAYIKAPIVNRKKNGIGLTKEGEELYRIAIKLDKFLNNTEKEIMQLIDHKITFLIGACQSVGKYVLPNFLGEIKDAIDNNVDVKIGTSKEVLEDLLNKSIDLALVGDMLPSNEITYREWLEDELVLFSKVPLPKFVKKDELADFRWITRDFNTDVHAIVSKKFEQADIDYSGFDIISRVSSSTAIKQTILKTEIKPDQKPIVSFIPKIAIEDEIASEQLYIARIRGVKLKRKLYVAYLKDDKRDAYVDTVANYIMSKKKL